MPGQSRFLEAPLVRQADGELKKSELELTVKITESSGNCLTQSCIFSKKNKFSLLQQLNYFQFSLHSFPRNYFQDCQLIMVLVYLKFRYSEKATKNFKECPNYFDTN